MRWALTPHMNQLHATYLKWREPRKDYYFPSDVTNVNDPSILDLWNLLKRGHEDEDLIKKWILKIRNFTMVTYDGLLTIAQLVRYCEQNNILGKYVETGTWKGGAFSVMAKASETWGSGNREIWGFDSFEGIPEPDLHLDDVKWAMKDMKLSKDQLTGQLRSVNGLVAAEQDVYSALQELKISLKSVKIFKGWFQNTLPKLSDEEIGPIAVLRLDGDLYASTMICLEKFEPHVVQGGFIIIDDWVLKGARQAVIDYYSKAYGRLPMLHFVDGYARYIQKI